MTTYYKAVRHDYGSFHNPDFLYGPPGTVVTHPSYRGEKDAEGAQHYISISTEPADCTGFKWRMDGKESRLLIVKPVGRVYAPERRELPNKRAAKSVRVVDELPISAAFGPNGEQVIAYLNLLSGLTADQWDAAWDAAWIAARSAAWALVVRDLITPEQFDLLTAPMRASGIDFDNLNKEEA